MNMHRMGRIVRRLAKRIEGGTVRRDWMAHGRSQVALKQQPYIATHATKRVAKRNTRAKASAIFHNG